MELCIKTALAPAAGGLFDLIYAASLVFWGSDHNKKALWLREKVQPDFSLALFFRPDATGYCFLQQACAELLFAARGQGDFCRRLVRLGDAALLERLCKHLGCAPQELPFFAQDEEERTRVANPLAQRLATFLEELAPYCRVLMEKQQERTLAQLEWKKGSFYMDAITLDILNALGFDQLSPLLFDACAGRLSATAAFAEEQALFQADQPLLPVLQGQKPIKLGVSALMPNAFFPVLLAEGKVGCVAGCTLGAYIKAKQAEEQANRLPLHVMAEALADPMRIELLKRLAAAPRCATDLAKDMGLAFPKIFYHLKLLAEAGFVTQSHQGKWVIYRYNPQGVAGFAARLPQAFVPLPPKEEAPEA